MHGATLRPRAVEVYLPVTSAGGGHRPIGVFEVYVPYQPIADSSWPPPAPHARSRVGCGAGLGLWLVLGAISWSSTRRIRRIAADNEWLARHDEALGLPNLVGFREVLDAQVAGDDRDPSRWPSSSWTAWPRDHRHLGAEQRGHGHSSDAARRPRGCSQGLPVARIGTGSSHRRVSQLPVPSMYRGGGLAIQQRVVGVGAEIEVAACRSAVR